MIIYIAIFLTILAAALLLLSAVAFLKAKDVFVMTHIIMIANCYIIPLLLIGIELMKFSWLSFAKTMVLIVLNLLIANLLCYAIARQAVMNKIEPDAEVKK
jgi:multisubunit Na+/H+ antiporter MnhG subunit